MAGRFAHALRTGQRATSPRRARAILVISCTLFCAALALVSSHARLPFAPHILDARTATRTVASSLKEIPAAALPKTAGVGAVTAKIVTCPRCRLNALPRVKEFVYKHAKTFHPLLKVDFILGEDPRLHLYKDGTEAENIDLAALDTTAIMKKLYAFGIRPNSVTPEVANALGPRPLLQRAPSKASQPR